MTRRLRIAVRPDGTIIAETQDVQGSACLDELDRIRRLTNGSVESSRLTQDYFAISDVGTGADSERVVSDAAGD